jgi:hypothetical protein
MLSVTALIDTQYLAVFEFFDESSHTIGITFGIYPAGPGAPSLRENQHRLIPFQKGVAFVKRLFHLLAVAATVDRDALRQITDNCQEYIPLKIIPFRQIPRKLSKSQ